MNKEFTQFLYYMKSYPLWEDMEKFLVEKRPLIPTFDPDEDNTARWKYESARREGFDLILELLKIEVNNE